RPSGSNTKALPSPSPITRRRPVRPRCSCSVLTNTTAGSHFSASSANDSGAFTPGWIGGGTAIVWAGGGAALAEALAAAPEPDLQLELQPAETNPIARATQSRATYCFSPPGECVLATST